MKLLIDRVHNLWYAYLMAKKQVYALLDPDTEKPKYIGVSCDPQSRLSQHIAQAKEEGNRRQTRERITLETLLKTEWICGLIENDKAPILAILEDSCTNYNEMELKWYKEFTAAGYKLFNSPRRVGINNSRVSNKPKPRRWLCNRQEKMT